MFTQRTIRPERVITSVNSPSEALAVSIGEHGKVDLPYMAELLGTPGEYAQITLCGEPLKLENGCQLLVLFSGTETVSLDISGSGTVVITQGLFNI